MKTTISRHNISSSISSGLRFLRAKIKLAPVSRGSSHQPSTGLARLMLTLYLAKVISHRRSPVHVIRPLFILFFSPLGAKLSRAAGTLLLHLPAFAYVTTKMSFSLANSRGNVSIISGVVPGNQGIPWISGILSFAFLSSAIYHKYIRNNCKLKFLRPNTSVTVALYSRV